ncbi:MAG TPA: flagellar biosynthesis anti-sigma factor FlgM [Bryobacteraceae bacterium]|nr:flagellar biosynthesis anti-sigma factor FlgM [Bryobacteraceae bacterium]
MNLAQAVAQMANAGAPSKTGAGSKRQNSDRVDISDMAAQLSVDPQKLGQLATAVQTGTYSVSPSQIAASMIDDMLAG